jgi:hypothetical protein
MQTEKEREKLLSALLDAINKSKHFANIPLPAALDNHLEDLNERFGYNKLDKKYLPKFEGDKEEDDTSGSDDSLATNLSGMSDIPSVKGYSEDKLPELESKNQNKPTREELSKKIREKIKNYRKRVDKIPPKTIL